MNQAASNTGAKRRKGPVPGPLGFALARLYGLEINRRNRNFDRGKGVIRFDRPVISVGNLSVGGTGKTPMVMHLVRALLDGGHRPCIAMRGYASRGGVSDEAEEYRAAFAEVPVVAQADRARGLIALFGEQYDSDGPHSDCIVLDDGFQHRRIARDMDIVLVDATRSPFEDRLLPAGWLREPVASLRRGSHIVLTHAEAVTPGELLRLKERVREACGREPMVARHGWSGVSIHEPSFEGEVRPAALDVLRGKRLLAVCAIGNPEPFLSAAQHASGVPLAGRVILRDHDPYASSTVQRIAAEAEQNQASFIITTAKDWSKLRRSSGALPCAVAVPALAMQFDSGGGELAAAACDLAARGVPEDDE